jgi:PAS domain S-box-containing protein
VVHSQGDVTWDETGRPLRQFGVLQDITELRQAERELRASEARFRTFVDHATDAFFLLDDQLTVLDVNGQAADSLGYSRDELIGMHPRIRCRSDEAAAIERIRQRVATGERLTFETRHRRKTGGVLVEIRPPFPNKTDVGSWLWREASPSASAPSSAFCGALSPGYWLKHPLSRRPTKILQALCDTWNGISARYGSLPGGGRTRCAGLWRAPRLRPGV